MIETAEDFKNAVLEKFPDADCQIQRLGLDSKKKTDTLDIVSGDKKTFVVAVRHYFGWWGYHINVLPHREVGLGFTPIWPPEVLCDDAQDCLTRILDVLENPTKY